ncbi:MAG: hypothetical protein QOJ81_253 [Chloroflexota bacterium]|nr:hypothetical protein [Chloroflexota bacterium]
MCLLRNDQEPQKECINVHEGTLSRAVFDAGQSEWNVTLLGTSGVAGQFGSLTLEFNALSPDIRLDSFRFNGTDNPHYNGFTVVFGTGADGTFRLRAQIDDGHDNPYQWHLNVAVDDVPVYDNTAGPDTSVDQSVAVSGGTAYTVLFEEPEASAGGGLFPVFVDARLTWP